MQGSVIVDAPYEMIGGVNLMADVDTGMSGSAATGEGTGAILLEWRLSDGIISCNSFGYPYGGLSESPDNEVTPAEMQEKVTKGEIDEEGINSLMRSYISKVLTMTGDVSNGWKDFYEKLGPDGYGCVRVL